MTTTLRAKAAGFTLIELMLAVGVLGILTAIAVPSFRQMLRNYEVRGASEAMAAGISRARAEAVSRNASVQFVLGAGTSWTVALTSAPGVSLDLRASTDSPNAAMVAVASDLATAATTLTFNNVGLLVGNLDASLPLGRVSVSAPGANEALRVEIRAGGSTRVCDPNLPTSNARAC